MPKHTFTLFILLVNEEILGICSSWVLLLRVIVSFTVYFISAFFNSGRKREADKNRITDIFGRFIVLKIFLIAIKYFLFLNEVLIEEKSKPKLNKRRTSKTRMESLILNITISEKTNVHCTLFL